MLSVILLSVTNKLIMLTVIMLTVIMLNVVMLSVAVPYIAIGDTQHYDTRILTEHCYAESHLS